MDAKAVSADVDREARNSTALEWAVRAGLVGYGVVHLLVAWVAVSLVVDRGSSGQASGSGALAQLAHQPGGVLVLGLLAIGFGAMVIWQLIAAAVGYRDSDGLGRLLMRIGAASRVVVYGYFAVSCAGFALQGGSSSGGSPQSTTAKVMAAPLGAVLVAAVGIGTAAMGVGLVVFGVMKKFLGQLERQARHGEPRTPIVVVGQVGYVVKGLAFVLLGVLFVWAAITNDPHKSGGLDHALFELLGRGLGAPAVIAIGAGIGIYGLYCFARAWFLDDNGLTS